ncbi:MAG: tyrosine--tRNA ligase [Chlorobi bacterium]|nr:MAG: tyrosyl-tRNA synthetase [Chlorobi bacterium OLB6]MBE2265571.1 tyrosine--tRNA ligase [Flavobacteriales bacterium]MBL1161729.1 tyrosine--tRNA ligase [Chlorobiota bacterium]MBW7853909.1 tyrosine--tRNA ligase [Candidatus Kapabacteria bacterium]MCC6331786.1 tyrosine--tRNA ligase [Ignavibacteria bacterium]
MTVSEQLSVVKQYAVDVLPEAELHTKLERSIKTGKPLRIKLGLDPSRPDIHIGHAVVLNKLRQFQDLGHTVVLIIGDFTAMIGDPTGKSKTRPALTLEETRANGKTYVDQALRILSGDRLEVVYNSEWLEALSFKQIIELASKYTVAQLLERDDFTKRYKSGVPISVHEFLYPLSQAYDSVAIHSDVELGGTDQKFNLLVGREVMRAYGQEPQCILTMPILEGTDGVEKMSKSLDNYIAITDTPRDMFGKTMSIPDSLITRYLEYAVFAQPAHVALVAKGLADGTLHPRTAKVEVAKGIVAKYHGPRAADEALAEFERVFVQKDVPDEIPDFKLPDGTTVINIITALSDTGSTASKSEARRLVQQGGVQLDGEKITDINAELTVLSPRILRVGKLKFYRLLPGN